MALNITITTKEQWKSDVAIGLILGFSFIFLNLLNPAISIGLPNLGLSLGGLDRILVVGVLAPGIEEILFRGALFGFLTLINLALPLVVLISAGTFVAYHFLAYGGSLAASGAFIGAGIFALIVSAVYLWRKSLLPGIILHSIFNIYLITKLAVVII